jgi:rare lipoprotein A
VEPFATRSNRPYVVFGNKYTPFTDDRPFKQRGIGSWYGKKFHGQKTSSGELYDMYKMTAAHPTLPIPSYARVTNLDNGKQVIVRVNDRGPFHSDRIIDLSYTAALKLGYLARGSGRLEVERLLPADIVRLKNEKPLQVTSVRQEQAAGDTAVPVSTAAVSPVAGASPAPSSLPQAATVTAGAARGYYLQIGTFSQAAGAESVRARLAESAAGILAPVEVAEQGALYRVYSGPFSSQSEAAAAAKQLRERGSFKPIVVQR